MMKYKIKEVNEKTAFSISGLNKASMLKKYYPPNYINRKLQNSSIKPES